MSKNTNTNKTRRAYEMAFRFMRVLSCNYREYDPAVHPMTYAGYARQVENLRAAYPQAVRAAQATMDAWKVREFNTEPISPRFAHAMKMVEVEEVVGYYIPAEALLSANDWPF